MLQASDIAEIAGVSRSTVSAVLSGKAACRRISAQTRDHILNVAKKYGYVPNAAASNLRRGKSNLIGILLPLPENNIYGTLLRELGSQIERAGHTCFYSFWENAEELKRAAETALARQVCGIITVAPRALPQNCEIPAISLMEEDPKYDCIRFSFGSLIRDAIRHFADAGHKYIAAPHVALSNYPEERDACLQELNVRNLSTRYIAEVLCTYNEVCCRDVKERAAKTVDWLLSFPPEERPTAMFLPTDLLAIHVLRECNVRRIRIPRDISIISCDNLTISQAWAPSLTSFGDMPENTLANNLLERLWIRMENPEMPPVRIIVPRKLFLRESFQPRTGEEWM